MDNNLIDISIRGICERAFICSGINAMVTTYPQFFGEQVITIEDELDEETYYSILNILKIDEFTDSEFSLIAYIDKNNKKDGFVLTPRRIVWNYGVWEEVLLEDIKEIIFKGNLSEPFIEIVDKRDIRHTNIDIKGIENIDVFKDASRKMFNKIRVQIEEMIKEYENEEEEEEEEEEEDEDDIEVELYEYDFTDRVEKKIVQICKKYRLDKLFYYIGDPIDLRKVKGIDKMINQYDIMEGDCFYLLFDSTTFSSWKRGALVSITGVYVNGDSKCHYYWPEFVKLDVYSHFSSLYIDDICIGNAPDIDKLRDIFKELQAELADMFYIDIQR